MGAQVGKAYFHNVQLKTPYLTVCSLWNDEEIAALIAKLKEEVLSYSMSKEDFIHWVQILPKMKANNVNSDNLFDLYKDDRLKKIDALEFLSNVIIINAQIPLQTKIRLLFNLYDFDNSETILIDSFIIFLKSASDGLNRVANGLPTTMSLQMLEEITKNFFSIMNITHLTIESFHSWILETLLSLNYLFLFSKCHQVLFAFGINDKKQLTDGITSIYQCVPSPLLFFENISIKQVAIGKSHSLFLSDNGKVYSSGLSLCGQLGHGEVDVKNNPELVKKLSSHNIVSISVGARHSAAVGSNGLLFVWGSCELGQLGLADTQGRWLSDVRTWKRDHRTGEDYCYVAEPTVVTSLLVRKIKVIDVYCNAFSTLILTSNGSVAICGDISPGYDASKISNVNNSFALRYIEPTMENTAVIVSDSFFFYPPIYASGSGPSPSVSPPPSSPINTTLSPPASAPSSFAPVKFVNITGGDRHYIALDDNKAVYTWGDGKFGKLGHGDEKSVFYPTLVENLQYSSVRQISAGINNTATLSDSILLTISSLYNNNTYITPCSLFSMSYYNTVAKTKMPSEMIKLFNDDGEVNSFLSYPLLDLTLPYYEDLDDYDSNIISDALYDVEDIENNDFIALVEKPLPVGVWLLLNTTNIDFQVYPAAFSPVITHKTSMQGSLFMPYEHGGNEFEPSDVKNMITIIESVFITSNTNTVGDAQWMTDLLQYAYQMLVNGASAVIFVLPSDTLAMPTLSHADLQLDSHVIATLNSALVALMQHSTGDILKNYLLEEKRKQSSSYELNGLANQEKHWLKMTEPFTGKVFYESASTGQKRYSAPTTTYKGTAYIVGIINQHSFFKRLRRLFKTNVKGVIISQRSSSPHITLEDLPVYGKNTTLNANMLFTEKQLGDIPICSITFSSGEELRGLAYKYLSYVNPSKADQFANARKGYRTQGLQFRNQSTYIATESKAAISKNNPPINKLKTATLSTPRGKVNPVGGVRRSDNVGTIEKPKTEEVSPTSSPTKSFATAEGGRGSGGDNSITLMSSEKIKSMDSQLLLSMSISEGSALYIWGDNTFSQCGLSSNELRPVELLKENIITGEERRIICTPQFNGLIQEQQIEEISLGKHHSLALTKDGKVLGWGVEDFLGSGDIRSGEDEIPVVQSPAVLSHLEGRFRVQKIFSGYDSNIVIADPLFKSIYQ